MDAPLTESATTIVAGQTGYAVPLVVAVTGHRDLVAGELPGIRDRLRTFLLDLRQQFPDRGVSIMSALAEGADQLAAEVALELGVPLTVVLPMRRDLYAMDFDTADSMQRFDDLCRAAAEVFELPVAHGNTLESIRAPGENRTRQYAQLGVFLCAHCHILLALWDGKVTDKLGGTGQVVRFHHDNIMPGYTPTTGASRLILTDDESDLVYHIVCSRDRNDGQPLQELQTLDVYWYTTDEKQPRTRDMPSRHRRVFEHTGEFSRDAKAHAERIREDAWPLFDASNAAELPAGVGDIDHVFRVADWLAIHFQKRTLLALRSTHIFALLMGLMYIVYSDLFPRKLYIVAFLAFFAMATIIHLVGKRGAWQRKYLDYRTLAEGLRVQFYWAAAGVTSGTVSKFAHDNFLQMQDPELGWIRNVMRVAGTECDVSPNSEKPGLAFTIREWIGDKDSGQLGYFRRKAAERVRRNRLTERLGLAGLWVSIGAITLFILLGDGASEIVRDPVTVIMGALLLLVGVRQSYAFSTADAELIKQYEFMLRIFHNARRRINAADNDAQRREILKVLGDAALEEHAEWILMHRERSLDQGEIWRMSG